MIERKACLASRHARSAVAAAGLLSLAAIAPVAAQGTCVATIRGVLAEIAGRDLDTRNGPPLNAFIALNPNAMTQAEALDRAAAAGNPAGPLACVPVAVKDNFDTYDLPATVGSLALIGNQPPRDATMVARLRRAGAIVVGKTNMDELAMGIRGLSGSGGRVGNAYDTRQGAGGSSAGSGVAVGAGLVPIALGSDNCGSLRIPAVYNGAVSLRATFGRFDTGGVFPIGFINGVPGVIARDAATLRGALAVVGDGWQDAVARTGTLAGKRIGVLRRIARSDPWAPGDADVQKVFTQAIALLRTAGAEIVEDVALPDFDPRLGSGFLKGFARKVDTVLASYPAVRRSWSDICTSHRVRPEWTARQCEEAGAAAPRLEQQAVEQIAANQHRTVATMEKLRLHAILYPVDGRGGARNDESPGMTCFIAGASGLPSAAFPVGLDGRGLPIGIELLGRPQSDEMLVAMLAAYEAARGPFPRPAPAAGNPDLAALDIPRQNALRLRLGWSAYRTRRGNDLGALAPERFRALTEDLVKHALSADARGPRAGGPLGR